jgi:molybdopterin-binding protein
MAPKSRGDNGKITRRAAMALIAGGGTVAISGTGAFTQAKVPRKFSLATATDENALLGIKTVDVTFTQTRQTKTILKLNNQTNSPVSLDNRNGIVVNTVHNFLNIVEYPLEIEPDDGWVDVRAQARKKRKNETPIELTINAESDSTSISAVYTLNINTDISRSLPKGCPVTPSVTVSVDDSAQSTVTNPGSLNKNVDGNVLISNGNDLDLTSNNTVSISGDIKGSSTGNIKLRNDKVGGDIISSSGKNVKLKHASAVDGYVKAGGSITVNGKQNSNTVVSEYIEAYKIDKIQDGIIGGDVRVTGGGGEIQRSKIGGDVTTSSGNDVSIKNSTVCGTVISGGNAKIKQGSKVTSVKTTTSGKNIKIKNGSEVTQNITLKGSGTVKIKNKSVVNGDITANNGTVKVKATVKGDVTADKVTIEGNGTIEGEITEK